MDDVRALLDRLPALAIPALLDELDAMQERREERPRVTLFLTSGHTVEGWLIALDRRARPPGLLLHDAGTDDHKIQGHAIYVDASTVMAARVYHADRYADVLSRDKPIAPSDAEIPSKLAMRRHLGETMAELAKSCGVEVSTELDWDAFPEGSEARWWLWGTLQALRRALAEVASWDDGRETVAASVRALRFEAAAISSVHLDDQTLIIALAAPIKADDLRRMIESAL